MKKIIFTIYMTLLFSLMVSAGPKPFDHQYEGRKGIESDLG